MEKENQFYKQETTERSDSWQRGPKGSAITLLARTFHKVIGYSFWRGMSNKGPSLTPSSCHESDMRFSGKSQRRLSAMWSSYFRSLWPSDVFTPETVDPIFGNNHPLQTLH